MVNKIYLDTNIVIDMLFAKRPNHIATMKVLSSYINDENCIFVLNTISISNIYYLGAEIYKDKTTTVDFLKDLRAFSNIWQIYEVSNSDIGEALEYLDIDKNADYEDLQQYISAKNSDCSLIITNDKGFPKLDIPLKRTKKDLENYNP